MFGYVRPFREELKVRELNDYEAMYCGLCSMIGTRCGFFARMFLNYDFVFLAMVLAPKEERPKTLQCRCPANPLKKKCACAATPGLEAAADESVILSYWKLQDTVADEGFWKGLAARILSIFLKRGYRKAAAARPEFDRQVQQCLRELQNLEAARSASLDATADTFARILQAAAPGSGDAAKDRALGELLYHVGRWVYLVDAWDDLKKDLACGQYNPIHYRFDGRELEEQAYLRTTLQHSLNRALSAYALLELGGWSGVVENILCLGLPAVEELVFRGEWKKPKK